jgi:hypothetical protein
MTEGIKFAETEEEELKAEMAYERMLEEGRQEEFCN